MKEEMFIKLSWLIYKKGMLKNFADKRKSEKSL